VGYNKSSGVTVNGDRSAEKGLGYYNDNNAVVYTPNSELNTRAMVRITNTITSISSIIISEFIAFPVKKV
jgi:hypothetical protein